MPGYRGPANAPDPSAAEAEGEAPSDEPDPEAAPDPDWAATEGQDGPWSEADRVPEVEPPRVPPRRPALPDVGAPTGPDTASRPAAPPAPAGGVRVIELDADNAYLIDDARGLCFFRHKATLAPVDCARVTPAPGPQPAAPQPPAPAPQPAAPTPRSTVDQTKRFEQAFIAIFCDRVQHTGTPSATRLQAAGLDAATYEAIEAEVAEDDARWLDLNTRASAACKPAR
jgi:hypothetical protein